MFVAEMGEIEGIEGGFRQHFSGRAGSRALGQGQLGSGAFWNAGFEGWCGTPRQDLGHFGTRGRRWQDDASG